MGKFDLIPVARDIVLESIPAMIFVVDSSDRLVDANRMAQETLGKSLQEILGHDPLDVFREWPALIQPFFMTENTRVEIQIPTDPPRILELIITPLNNEEGQLEGRAIVAYDITERKNLEVTLQQRLDEIQALHQALREQAIRDPLTGVFNRRYFSEALDQEVARAERDGSRFSLIILDVDHFKKFNDTYGHKCGDLVLQSLARFLQENTRRGDIVCRYGGEEFVILLPDTDLNPAYQRAEELRAQFDAMSVAYESLYLRATFSAGVACYPVSAKTGEGALTAADQALYRSKEAGRNCVTLHAG